MCFSLKHCSSYYFIKWLVVLMCFIFYFLFFYVYFHTLFSYLYFKSSCLPHLYYSIICNFCLTFLHKTKSIFSIFIYTLLFLCCVAHCGRPLSWQTWDVLKMFFFLCWAISACHRNVMLPSAGQLTSSVRGKEHRENDQNHLNILWGEKYFRLLGECRLYGELLRLQKW